MRLVLTLLAAGLASGSSFAAPIITYPFTTAGSSTPSFVAPETTTAFSSANLNSIIIGNDGFGVVLQAYQKGGATSPTGALTSNNFFTISVSANPGWVLNLTSLTFDAGPGGNRTLPDSGYFVRSSVDGFASDLFSQTYPAGPQTTPASQAISLSTPANQDLNSITFRFYTFVGNTSSQSDDFRNIQLNGTVTPVPEPATLAVFGGIALAGAFGYRRRKATAPA